jgi:hypothetical protein
MAIGQGLAVGDIACTILNAVVSHYSAASGIALPDRRIIAPGEPRSIAWDCEQCVITLSGLGLGAAPTQGATAQRTSNPVSATGLRHAVFATQIVRCVPESQDGTVPPDVDEVNTAGLLLMRDAGLLSQALVEACSTLAAGLGRHGSAQPGAVEMLGPEGGMAAVEGSIAVTVGTLA